MNPQPGEQSGRPHRPLSDRRGTILPATPARLLAVEERALPNAAAPSLPKQPVFEHLANAPGARRISMVETVAIQIFSGAIEVGVSERKEFGSAHGTGQHRWPLLLSRGELCEYLGVSWRTLKNVLTVRPVDMGANVVRYNRDQIDAWVATLPPRLLASTKNGAVNGEVGASTEDAVKSDTAESRVEAALDRVRARAGGSKWRKSE